MLVELQGGYMNVYMNVYTTCFAFNPTNPLHSFGARIHVHSPCHLEKSLTVHGLQTKALVSTAIGPGVIECDPTRYPYTFCKHSSRP